MWSLTPNASWMTTTPPLGAPVGSWMESGVSSGMVSTLPGSRTRCSGAVTHLALVGPTASGKSAVSMQLARSNPGVELVSIDSMQVDGGVDIATATHAA